MQTPLMAEAIFLSRAEGRPYKQPFRSASKEAHLCNQQVDFVSTFRKLFEKGWRQICLFSQIYEKAPKFKQGTRSTL